MENELSGDEQATAEELLKELAEELAALEYAIKQVPELASVPGIKAAIKKESSES